MKKSLLFSAALLAASSAFAFQNAKPVPKGSDMIGVGPKAPSASKASFANTRASGAIDFTYAEEVYTAIYFTDGITPGTSRVYMMFDMAPEDIKANAGNQVTGFTVYSPTNSNYRNTLTEGRFFYTTTFTSEDYTQDFSFSREGFGVNVVTLDTPYTITGEEETLAFGYSLVVPKSNNLYYVPVDGMPNDNPGSCVVNVSDDGTFPTEQWSTLASVYGALCMSIKIEGDNLPENKAVISGMYAPLNIPLSGDGVDVQFAVRNTAANDLSSVEVAVSMTDTPEMVQTIDFTPVAFNETAVLTVNGVKATTPCVGTLGIRLTKVNGVEVDGNEYTAVVPALDNGFETKIVAEDATGTWCGWCPGGIEALEYLKSVCPDRAIAIGAHSDDEMAISSYVGYINAYVSGFPNVMYNRSIDQTPTDTYANVCAYIDEVVKLFDFPAYANVELTGVTNADKTAAEVTAKATFVVDTNVPHMLSFVVVEDGVGPYAQANNFYRNQYGLKMNGWESKSTYVATYFNDVARYYDCFPGIENSLPAEIQAGVANEYSIALPITNVSKDDYRVIALLTNAANGRIVNACQIDMNKDTTTTGVADMMDESAPVEYFNLNGMKVAEPTEGIYIRRQGSKTEKVTVK